MNSILDPTHHKRLIQDLPHVCQVANVLPVYIHQSMKGVCRDTEISWVQNFRTHQAEGTGLLMLGVPRPEARIMAIAGALLRNYVDARVVSVTNMLDLKEQHALPDCTVMLVPNLFLRSGGKAMPSWKVNLLYDIMLSRLTSNRPTVVFVEDLDALAADYGRVFADHLSQHYLTVEQ